MINHAVVIGTVHADQIDAVYTHCLVATLSEDTRRLLAFRAPVLLARAPAGMIHLARNEIVRAFLAHPLRPAYLLFIDTDITWEPELVWRLVDCASAEDLPAVSGFYSLAEQEAGGPGEPVPMLYDEQMHLVPIRGDLQRVFCAGAGFLLLRRDVLEACFRAYAGPAPWFDYGARGGRLVSEDVIFCQRLWDLDIPLHVLTTVHVGHRKVHTLRFLPLLQCVSL
jgi:hypothetical protein